MTRPNGYIKPSSASLLWVFTLQISNWWYEYRVPKKLTTKEKLENAYDYIEELEAENEKLKRDIEERDAILEHKYFSKSDIELKYDCLLADYDDVLNSYDTLLMSMLEQGFEGLGCELSDNRWILSLTRNETININITNR